jgi:hypothetical protein
MTVKLIKYLQHFRYCLSPIRAKIVAVQVKTSQRLIHLHY